VLFTNGEHTVAAAATLVKTEYWHKDHLGSSGALTDATGAVTQRYAYDPWGKRRHTDGRYDAFGTLIADYPSGSDRGFTGHEHLDDIGLIHMNGRLYDPHLGRFLQPDPYVQALHQLQHFNRYSYVLNNPLNATDPSGELIAEFAIAIAATFVIAKTMPELRPLLAIAWSIALGPGGPASLLSGSAWAGVGNAAIAGFTSGVVSGGGLKGGLRSAFSAVLFHGIGQGFGNVGWANPEQMLGAMAAHAVAGCVSHAISGGDCGQGAAAAALSKAFSPALPGANATMGEKVMGTIASAILGGTASHLGGGKFANGAVTAAFGYVMNNLSNAEL
jgi:RHS repeat-associated protein